MADNKRPYPWNGTRIESPMHLVSSTFDSVSDVKNEFIWLNVHYLLIVVSAVPLFPAKREVFAWIKDGKKTIDVRKGKARRGEVAVFQFGRNCLRRRIIKKETGRLTDVIKADNYRSIIPTAKSLQEAQDYLRGIYEEFNGLFTAYYLEPS